MATASYKVETPVFSGPLELLLNLIEEKKLFINDISLAKVADDYINYIKTIHDFPIAESAQFILVASTLLLIKSKSLLPTLELTREEEGDIKDLELRLKIYKRMRELSGFISKKFGMEIIFPRGDMETKPVFSPDSSMALPNLLLSLQELLQSLPKKDILPKAIVDKVISLEEMINSLTERISASLKMSFRNFANPDKENKINVIVSFLAMLELVKQGIIAVTQERHFEDITMETENLDTPRY